MQSELDVVDALNALEYKGPCLQNDVQLAKVIAEGTNNADFRELITWLSSELHVLRKTDEHLTSDNSDTNEFIMELSAMLKELGCPFDQLVTGPFSQRYNNTKNCLLLIEYMTSELMAIKMCLRLRPQKDDSAFVIVKKETNTAAALEQLVKDLHVGSTPANISAKAFFNKLNFKLEEGLRKVKPAVLSEPLLKLDKPLSIEQWRKLEDMHAGMETEYNLRREMLLTRLEVTVQSFNWSDRMKKQTELINERFQSKFSELKALTNERTETDIVALLAARKDLAIIEKTSSANVRKKTGCDIQKHVIGSVPDRGGRTNEHVAPPPEMPAWQQKRSGPPAGTGERGGARGGGGRGGGGRGGGYRGGRGGGGGGNNWEAQPQRQQYQQQDNHQSWMSGSGRVQGVGWSQNQYADKNNYDRDNNENRRGGGRGGGGYSRGQSNYNRGSRR